MSLSPTRHRPRARPAPQIGAIARRTAPQVGLLVLLVAAWYWASHGGRVSPLLLPTPESVASDLGRLVRTSTMWDSVRTTVIELVAAFAISLGGGLVMGALATRSAYLARVIEPVIGWVQLVPIVLLYPVTVLLFGIGMWSKIVFAGVYGFFPVALATIRALTVVDERLVRAARSMGASERQLLWHVKVPSALPALVAGVRIGAALNLIGVLAGEILASTAGLGYRISVASQTFEPADTYSYIIIALVLVALFNALVTRGEQRRATP